MNLEFLDRDLRAAGLPITGLAAQAAIVPKSTPVTWHAKDGGFVAVYWPSTPTAPQEVSAAGVVAAFDTSAPAEAERVTAAQRAQAVALLADPAREAKLLRAILLVILDEVNLHAAKINSILTAVDGAASYGAMRTAIAAIADYPPRTAAQLRTAIQGKLNAGDADS